MEDISNWGWQSLHLCLLNHAKLVLYATTSNWFKLVCVRKQFSIHTTHLISFYYSWENQGDDI